MVYDTLAEMKKRQLDVKILKAVLKAVIIHNLRLCFSMWFKQFVGMKKVNLVWNRSIGVYSHNKLIHLGNSIITKGMKTAACCFFL